MDSLIKPTERKRLQEALARCSECRSLHDALKRIPGVDVQDRESRLEATENRLRGILDVDRMISATAQE